MKRKFLHYKITTCLVCFLIIQITNGQNWQTCQNWDYTDYGSYRIRNNIWGSNHPGAGQQCMWANSPSHWGVTAYHQNNSGEVKAYPQVVRGWLKGDWSNDSILPIKIDDLDKAKIHWTQNQLTSGRTLPLWDIYFHDNTNPTNNASRVALMIFPYWYDSKGWFSEQAHTAPQVTIDGVSYHYRIEGPQFWALEHNIVLFVSPISDFEGGCHSITIDLKKVITHFVDNGPLRSSDYLLGIHAGWEIIEGGTYETTNYWVSLQNEPIGEEQSGRSEWD